MKDKKTEGQKLEKELTYKKENFFTASSDEKIKKAFEYAEDKRLKPLSRFAKKRDLKNIVSEINSKSAGNITTTTEGRALPYLKSVKRM